MNEFKLSDSDKSTLLGWGFKETDLPQVEKATRCGIFSTKNNKSISWQTAKKIVGAKEFLSGISRSAFHGICYRENKVGTIVLFNFRPYFGGGSDYSFDF